VALAAAGLAAAASTRTPAGLAAAATLSTALPAAATPAAAAGAAARLAATAAGAAATAARFTAAAGAAAAAAAAFFSVFAHGSSPACSGARGSTRTVLRLARHAATPAGAGVTDDDTAMVSVEKGEADYRRSV